MVATGKSVRLFLVDGTPGGLITAEIMNWTGHVIAASRSDLDRLLVRPELSRTGIYILLGENPNNAAEPFAYIGEGDQIRSRLYSHARSVDQKGKDFWNRAIVMTSKDANLTKAHARYLESRLIELAKKARRSSLTNGTSPDVIALPEADISDMEFYISQVEIILPLLGVNILRATKQTPKPTPPDTATNSSGTGSPVFEMRLKELGIVARAQEVDGEFIVLTGSEARPGWSGAGHGYRQMKQELEASGRIKPGNSTHIAIFQDDHAFSSPSAAAAMVAGRAANGRIEWKNPESQITFGEWQDQKLEQTKESVGSEP